MCNHNPGGVLTRKVYENQSLAEYVRVEKYPVTFEQGSLTTSCSKESPYLIFRTKGQIAGPCDPGASDVSCIKKSEQLSLELLL